MDLKERFINNAITMMSTKTDKDTLCEFRNCFNNLACR